MPANIGKAGWTRPLKPGYSLSAKKRSTCAITITTAPAHIALTMFVPITLAREDELRGNDRTRYQGDRHTTARTSVSGTVKVAVSNHPMCAETLITQVSIAPSGTQAAKYAAKLFLF